MATYSKDAYTQNVLCSNGELHLIPKLNIKFTITISLRVTKCVVFTKMYINK